jgi:surface antigen
MNRIFLSMAAALAVVATPIAAPALGAELPPYLQCVPYARQVSGINIFGDAHTWWDQADGRYSRGHKPRIGAVMAFRPHGNMRLGHVAAVSKIIDSRTVLLRHANWSPIDGRRGQVENDVRAIDVSPENDWSEVRVWYAPLQDIGKTAWPVEGFIYGDRSNERLIDHSNDRPGLQPAKQIAADLPRRGPTKAQEAKPRDVVGDIIGRNS